MQVDEFGVPPFVRAVERSTPEPVRGQALVVVEAAGVSFADGLIARGLYQIKPELPFVPGSTLAGHVVSVGDERDEVWVGRRVFANGFGGAWATHACVELSQLVELPGEVSCVRAAALGESYGTAWFALVDRGHVEPNQTVLVLGAGSGVGLAAVDVARYLGATVIACASDESKRAAARAAGADVTIANDDIAERVRELAPEGVDVIVDPVGGALALAALRLLRRCGRHLVVGFASGEIPQFPANRVLLRNRLVMGVDWGDEKREAPASALDVMNRVLSLVANDELSPISPTRITLAEIGDALDDLAERRVVGKIVAVPG